MPQERDGFSSESIEESVEKYERLREQLKSFSMGDLKESEDYRELTLIQDRLVMLTVDSPAENSVMVQRIKDLTKPSILEIRAYPLYEMLSIDRNITIANYLLAGKNRFNI